MTETKDERFERLLETLCELWDHQKLMDLINAEYQRGRDDYRDELLKKMDIVRDVIGDVHPSKKMIAHDIQDVEHKTSDEVALSEDASGKLYNTPAAPPVAPKESIEDKAPVAESTTSEAPTTEKKASVYRGTSTPRPEGIPSTFTMIATILFDCPGLNAHEVGDKIRERWWPGLDFKRIGPEFSTWIHKKRLTRDADGKLTLTWRGHNLAFPDLPNPYPNPVKALSDTARYPAAAAPVTPHVLPREPARSVPMPPVLPTGGVKPQPPVREQPGMVYRDFQYGGKRLRMPFREYAIVCKLRDTMGNGHLGISVLADAMGGPRRSEIDNKLLLREMCNIINLKIEEMNLKIQYFDGFGFIMTEISALAAE